MSQHVAIVWDRPHFTAVAFDLAAGKPHLIARCAADLDDGLSDSELVRDLVDQLRAAEFNPSTVSIVVPRDRVTWRDFDVPQVPDHELPAIVQFQFATQVAGTSDRSVIDFLPPAPVAAGSPFRIHAAALPERFVLLARQVASELSAELTSVTVSSIALLEIAERLEPNAYREGYLGVVAVGDRYAETAESVRGFIERSSVRRHAGGDAANRAYLAERNRLELNLDDGEAEQAAIVCFGPIDTDSASVSVSRDALDTIFDLGETTDWENASLLAAVGSALSASSLTDRQLNFAKPREPVPPRDRTKDYLRLGIAAAVLCIVGVGWKTWSDAAALDEKIESAETKIDEINSFLKSRGEARTVRASLEGYIESRMPLAAILDRMLEAMPPRDRLVIAEFEPSQTTGTNVARVKGKAYAATRGDAELFEAELDQIFQVKPQAKVPTDERPGYEYSLSFEFDVPEALLKSLKKKTDAANASDNTAANLRSNDDQPETSDANA